MLLVCFDIDRLDYIYFIIVFSLGICPIDNPFWIVIALSLRMYSIPVDASWNRTIIFILSDNRDTTSSRLVQLSTLHILIVRWPLRQCNFTVEINAFVLGWCWFINEDWRPSIKCSVCLVWLSSIEYVNGVNESHTRNLPFSSQCSFVNWSNSKISKPEMIYLCMV